MDKPPEKVSDFINRHTNENNQINVVAAMAELYVHINTIKDALGDYGQFAIHMEDEIMKLKGHKVIDVVSPDQAKIILGK